MCHREGRGGNHLLVHAIHDVHPLHDLSEGRKPFCVQIRVAYQAVVRDGVSLIKGGDN